MKGIFLRRPASGYRILPLASWPIRMRVKKVDQKPVFLRRFFPFSARRAIVQQTKFAIIFVGRQGSSYLEGLLNSHPDARCDGEILCSGGPCDMSDYPSVEDFLRQHLHAGSEKAAGFKMPWLSFETFPETWGTLRRLDYRLIHLTRDNKLDQFISTKLAIANSAWRSDFGDYKIRTIVIDRHEMEAAINHWSFQDAMLAQAVRSFPHIHMTYEELVLNGGSLALNFLGLRPYELKSPFKKQRSGRQIEIVENYGELKRQLFGSTLARYFVD